MHTFEKYNQLEKELNALIGPQKFTAKNNLKLERITLLLERLGNPQDSYKTIHVGGTAGKGSTATMIANILQKHGHKVGLHTSPHLQICNERHVVNGKPLSTTTLWNMWSEITPHVEWMRQNSIYGAPTYFEAHIALSFLSFKHAGVDYGVIEVGLGGTLDATNAITPIISVLTNVDLDHTEILGDTVEKIATDKAGIIKPHVPVVTGASQDSVISIFKTHAKTNESEIYILNQDFNLPQDILIGVLGEKQLENAALAIQTTNLVLKSSLNKKLVHQALLETHLPARVEILQEKPLVILDGAHNPAKIHSSIETIRDMAQDKKIHVLISLKKGKDSVGILEPILSVSKNITCTGFTQALWEPVSQEEIKKQILEINPYVNVTTSNDPLVTVKNIIRELGPSDVLWIVGSLYLAGEVREHWFPKEKLLIELE